MLEMFGGKNCHVFWEGGICLHEPTTCVALGATWSFLVVQNLEEDASEIMREDTAHVRQHLYKKKDI